MNTAAAFDAMRAGDIPAWIMSLDWDELQPVMLPPCQHHPDEDRTAIYARNGQTIVAYVPGSLCNGVRPTATLATTDSPEQGADLFAGMVAGTRELISQWLLMVGAGLADANGRMGVHLN